MRAFINTLGKQAVLTAAMLLLAFSPFTTLVMEAHAQQSCGTPGANPATCIPAGSAAAPAPTGSGTKSPTAACDVTSPSTYDLCISNVVYVFTVGIGTGFAYVAAYFFDIAIQLSLNGTAYGLTFISTGWTTARDLANMAFLFILLFIAFQILYSAETSGTMSLLAGVIAVALVVNFSFFITRVVIDAGNILSIQFYNSIQAPAVSQMTQGQTTASNVAAATGGIINTVTGANNSNTKDLTASIMGMLQLQNIFGTDSFNKFYETQKKGSGFLVVLLTLSFLYIAAAMILWGLTVTFITIGIKFLTRIVVLWFLIIFSPLAFVAWAVPQFKKYFVQWRGLLISHAFYPVAFMFVFLLLNNFTQQMGNCAGQAASAVGSAASSCLLSDVFGSFSGVQDPNTPFLAILGIAFANIAIRLGFVLAILYMGMKAADSVSVFSAKGFDKAGERFGGIYANWMKSGGRLIPRAATGVANTAAGAAYRQSVGRAGNYLATTLKSSSWANKTGTPGGIIGYRLQKDVAEPLVNSSIAGGSSFKQREAYLETRRKDMDKNREDQLGKIKNREDVQNLAKINKEWDPLEAKYNPLDARIKEIKTALGPALDPAYVGPITAANIALKAELADKEAQAALLKPDMDKLRPKREQFLANVEKMEGTQVVALNGKDIEAIIQHISDKQLKAVKESLKFSNEEKNKLNKEWHERSKKAPLAESKEQIKKLADVHEELRKIGFDLTKLPKMGSFVKLPAGDTISINLAAAKTMKKEIEDQQAIQEDTRDNTGASHADRQIARQAIRQLKKAADNIKKLEDTVKDVPKEVGGTDKEGEFTHVGK